MKGVPCSAILVSTITVMFSCKALAFRPLFAPRRSMMMNSLSSMPTLPSEVVKYSQVPSSGDRKVFTADKIPRGLLKEHTTKAGTWGIINVSKGALEYKILEPTTRVFELNAETKGVIEPTVLHQVKALTDDVEFVVEFYRKPGTGPVDEKRED